MHVVHIILILYVVGMTVFGFVVGGPITGAIFFISTVIVLGLTLLAAGWNFSSGEMDTVWGPRDEVSRKLDDYWERVQRGEDPIEELKAYGKRGSQNASNSQ